jgi:hypothetical protein
MTKIVDNLGGIEWQVSCSVLDLNVTPAIVAFSFWGFRRLIPATLSVAGHLFSKLEVSTARRKRLFAREPNESLWTTIILR